MAEKRRRRHWIFGILAAIVIAFVIWRFVIYKPAAKPKPGGVPVTVTKVVVQDVPQSIVELGAAQAWHSDTILAQVTGTLLRTPFTEGQTVRKGQVIAEIDPASYRAVLIQAQGALKRDEALLANARLDLIRYQTLARQDSIARQQADTQAALVREDEGTVLVDKGTVDAARVNLDRCRITSPVTGRVGVRLIDPGNLVSAGGSASTSTGTSAAAGTTTVTGVTANASGIVIVNEIEPIAVTFSVPQGDYLHLVELSDGFRKPLATEALSPENGASLGSGELTIADNRVNPATGSVELKARFANTGDKLLPGQFVNVKLSLQTLSHVLTIPNTAVNQGPNGTFAFVVGTDHKAHMRPIKLGWTQGNTVVVTNGLSAGETVVTDGQMSLDNGLLVKLPGEKTAAQPGAPSAGQQTKQAAS